SVGVRGERLRWTRAVRRCLPDIIDACAVVREPDMATVGRPLMTGGMLDLNELFDGQRRLSATLGRLRGGADGEHQRRSNHEQSGSVHAATLVQVPARFNRRCGPRATAARELRASGGMS